MVYRHSIMRLSQENVVLKQSTLGQYFFCQLIHMSACEKVNLLTCLLEQVKSNLEVADFVQSDLLFSLFGVIYNLGLKYWVNTSALW